MFRRLLIQIAAPSVLVGGLVFAVSLYGAWRLDQMQNNLSHLLAQNLASLQAAVKLELAAREMRFHSLEYLIDRNPKLLETLERDEKEFQYWLDRAESAAFTDIERQQVAQIHKNFADYLTELAQLRDTLDDAPGTITFQEFADGHPLQQVVEPCRNYAELNQQMMREFAEKEAFGSQQVHSTLLVLGLAAPLGGVLAGYGIARALSQKLYRLSVRVEDVVQQLETDVARIDLTTSGDLENLDQRMEQVVGRVSEVMAKVQQQQQELLRNQQLAAVGQLAASIAHEVRNPLTSIKLLTEAGLRDQRPKPLTPESLRVVHGEVLRLERIVQDLLDFARPPKLKRVRTELKPILERSMELIRSRASQQGVSVKLKSNSSDILAKVDAAQISSVLVNMLLNALDAMPSGGEIELDVSRVDSNARITVRDTGIGIAPEMQNKLFVPFASNKATGTGLGLSICKRVVDEHGGKVSGRNVPGGGAEFTILLPAA